MAVAVLRLKQPLLEKIERRVCPCTSIFSNEARNFDRIAGLQN
jgi:hypothetical protein